MKVKINKYNIEGVSYYRGFRKFLWFYIPVTMLSRYKEEIKESLNIY